MDKIKVTILEDGTIRTETDRISLPNHSNAEGFLRQCFKLAGGKAERRFKHGLALAHQHSHEHEHEHHHH